MNDIRKKKILMTLMRLEIGGAETHVLELSLELARKGFEVVVASGGGVYEEYFKKAGIRHYTVPMYTKSPQKVLASLSALKKIIRDEQIDIVHAHGRIPAFLCGLLHPFMDFTFVTTAHWVFRTSYGFKYLSNWGKKVMSVSEDIKTYLMDNYGTDPTDIYVTINGIDTNRFSPEVDFSETLKEFSLSPNSKKIVYISRMDEDRAQVAFELANVALEIEKACPGVEIIIVGGGNVFSKLEALSNEVNEKAGRKLITLTGARTDIDKFAGMSDLFIGVSRSALEAMSCAKPVIVAGNEGYLGIFDEDKLQTGIDTNFCCRGLELSCEDKLLSDVLKVLSADEVQLEAWRAYSREIICRNYSVSKMAEDNIKMYCDAVEEKDWDVVISGYYGYGNSGDEALLHAMLKHLKAKKEHMRICVLSKNPEETAKEHDVTSINRYDYFKIKKVLKNTKLFISGGGSLLQDITSSKSLWYYLMLVKMAQKMKTPVMLYANGIGPVIKTKNQKKVAEVLKDVDFITLREPESKEELKKLGLDESQLIVTADPALSLHPADASIIDKIFSEEGIDPSEKLLGISLRPWKNCSQNYEKELAKAISEICKANAFTPVFLPLKHPEDLELSNKIAKMIEGKSYIISRKLNASEMIGVVGKMHLMLAMRLHSLIYAADVFVPTVGLNYDPKVNSFMQYIGISNAVSVEEFDAQILKHEVSNVLEHYEELKGILQENISHLKDKAIENADIAYKIVEQSEGNYVYETDGN